MFASAWLAISLAASPVAPAPTGRRPTDRQALAAASRFFDRIKAHELSDEDARAVLALPFSWAGVWMYTGGPDAHCARLVTDLGKGSEGTLTDPEGAAAVLLCFSTCFQSGGFSLEGAAMSFRVIRASQLPSAKVPLGPDRVDPEQMRELRRLASTHALVLGERDSTGHQRHDYLITAWTIRGAEAEPRVAKLIFLGDYITVEVQ